MMFAGKDEAYLSEAPFSCSTLGWAKLERLARDKHSSLLRKSVNYDCNKFIVQAPLDVK